MCLLNAILFTISMLFMNQSINKLSASFLLTFKKHSFLVSFRVVNDFAACSKKRAV